MTQLNKQALDEFFHKNGFVSEIEMTSNESSFQSDRSQISVEKNIEALAKIPDVLFFENKVPYLAILLFNLN